MMKEFDKLNPGKIDLEAVRANVAHGFFDEVVEPLILAVEALRSRAAELEEDLRFREEGMNWR